MGEKALPRQLLPKLAVGIAHEINDCRHVNLSYAHVFGHEAKPNARGEHVRRVSSSNTLMLGVRY